MKLKTPLFKKPYIELENEHEKELFKLDKDKEIERLNEYISFYEDLSKKQNKEIGRLNDKLSKIKELINRTPRQTPKEIAYVWLKADIAKVIGDDKK